MAKKLGSDNLMPNNRKATNKMAKPLIPAYQPGTVRSSRPQCETQQLRLEEIQRRRALLHLLPDTDQDAERIKIEALQRFWMGSPNYTQVQSFY